LGGYHSDGYKVQHVAKISCKEHNLDTCSICIGKAPGLPFWSWQKAFAYSNKDVAAVARICVTVVKHSCLYSLLLLIFSLGGCAVSLVGPYDEVTDQAITDLANRTEEFLTRVETTGEPYHGNESFYSDAKARLRTIKLRSALYPNNTGELKLLDLLSENLDNLAELHRAGPLTGAAGDSARKLIETNFESLLQVELAKKRSSGVSAPKA
jgi:hypothetical protein